jgi:O-6-methylguanine DNA methyltransferase
LSVFQIMVLQATLAINYGDTKTYAQIANQIDHPKSARAVGRAQATNPMPIVIPCHRVIGSDSSLHGYSGRGGAETKAWLLALEASHRLKGTYT